MRQQNLTNTFPRRDFLKIGSLGSLAINLPGVLKAGEAGPAPRRELSIILLWQSGGCSHLDTFDMKPGAPVAYRGEFKPIATRVAGLSICEHLPLTARVADQLTVVRSMTSGENNHERATNYLLTGHLPHPSIDYPSVGSVISRELGSLNGLPPYVAVPNTFPSYGAGFLGSRFDPFVSGAPHTAARRIGDLTVSIPAHQPARRLEGQFRAIEADAAFAAAGRATQDAFSVVSRPAARRAFDLDAEPARLRERYGLAPMGEGSLLARRLIESGVRFVTVGKGWLNYDTHEDNFNTLKSALLPEFDAAFATLVADLSDRGLLDSTLVIAMGEFGRSPLINQNAGRDHHAKAWSVVLAGGGLPGGRVVGATDHIGAEVISKPVRPEDLIFTLYSLLGLDPAKPRQARLDQPTPLANGGVLVKELLA